MRQALHGISKRPLYEYVKENLQLHCQPQNIGDLAKGYLASTAVHNRANPRQKDVYSKQQTRTSGPPNPFDIVHGARELAVRPGIIW